MALIAAVMTWPDADVLVGGEAMLSGGWAKSRCIGSGSCHQMRKEMMGKAIAVLAVDCQANAVLFQR